MRVKRVVLENHCDVAIPGRDIVHQFIANINFAVCNLLEASDHSKSGAFAAARGADQDNEFVMLNIQVDSTNGIRVIKTFS